MKLTVSKSKNSASFYTQKSIRKPNASVTTVTIEKLGNLDEIRTKAGGMEPYVWAQEYVNKLNRREYEEQKESILSFSPSKFLKKDLQKSYNCGYLFLQKSIMDSDWTKSVKTSVPDIFSNVTPMMSCQSLSIPGSFIRHLSWLPTGWQLTFSKSRPLNSTTFTVPFPYLPKKTTSFRQSFTKIAKSLWSGAGISFTTIVPITFLKSRKQTA